MVVRLYNVSRPETREQNELYNLNPKTMSSLSNVHFSWKNSRTIRAVKAPPLIRYRIYEVCEYLSEMRCFALNPKMKKYVRFKKTLRRNS